MVARGDVTAEAITAAAREHVPAYLEPIGGTWRAP